MSSILSFTPEGITQHQYDGHSLPLLIEDSKRILNRTEFPFRTLNAPVDFKSLLEAMLDYAPSPEGQRWVALNIHAAHFDQTGQTSVLNYGIAVLENLLLPIQARANAAMKEGRPESTASSGHTPAREDTGLALEAARRKEQADFREKLMARERFRCIITRRISDPYPLGRSEADQYGRLEAAHILPASLNYNVSTESATTWDMFKHWTGIRPQDCAGELITRPANGLLLSEREHGALSSFKLWFEPVTSANAPIPNTYKVCLRNFDPSALPVPQQVTFRDDQLFQNQLIPPPAPDLLKIHAAFAKVLHACGALELYEQWEDESGTSGKVFDQNSLGLLNARLRAIQVA
ncbi:hypothetical protein CYLTODRAFT_442037 [Cylindrobasidium torrendii FP15055 ss-10]|uniref:HNH nuclease domain-containing protein n=1 Tax=Cylindrobasidium torrendii FP15055 ss-10 TaxID=1314674 RepID=A0A0D7BJR5_9AGAR|nr:hypothetical protein CYLTODRAFT_442037 [Cylindrobasidium torrendii FP15055 ss-10]